MNKYLIISLSSVLFLVIVGLLFFKFVVYKGNKATVSTTPIRKEIPEPDVKISKYILGATVTAINNNEISVTLQRLFQGDNGNYFDTDNKVVQVSSSTEIVMGKLVNKKYSEGPANFSDIKVGQKLVFYSSENIKIMSVFSPYKIIISQ